MAEQEPAELAVEAGWKRNDLGFARRSRRDGIMRFNHGPSISLVRPSLRPTSRIHEMQGYRAGLSFTTGKWQDRKSGIEHLAHVGRTRLMWV
jgi:hypothetical protein